MKRFFQSLFSCFSLSTEACLAEWGTCDRKFPISITRTVIIVPTMLNKPQLKKMIPTISIFFCTVESFNYMGANFLGFLDFCLFERMYFVFALVFSVSRKTKSFMMSNNIIYNFEYHENWAITNSNDSTVYKSMTRILSFCVCCVNILSTREVTMPSSLPRCSSMFWGCWGTASLSTCCRWNSCCSTSWYCRDSILEFWASSTANILWMFSFSWINTQTEMCKRYRYTFK